MATHLTKTMKATSTTATVSNLASSTTAPSSAPAVDKKTEVWVTFGTNDPASWKKDDPPVAEQDNHVNWVRVREHLGVQVRPSKHELRLAFANVKDASNWSRRIKDQYDEAKGAIIYVGRATEEVVKYDPSFGLPEPLYHLLNYMWFQQLVYHPSTKTWTFHRMSQGAKDTALAWLGLYKL
jgi:hypothetical protein